MRHKAHSVFVANPEDVAKVQEKLKDRAIEVGLDVRPWPQCEALLTLDRALALEFCYADPRVWDGFTPGLFTLASSDPQSFRPPGRPPNILQVTLASNFKVARFEDSAHTAMLLELGSAVEAARFDLGDGSSSEVPVKLKVHDSVFVPLAKWNMLLTGNYRCIEAEGIRSIREAVHSDLAASRDIYDWFGSVLRAIGAHDADVVPFDDYADAALSLTKPSSIARALAAGATDIERVDLLVQTIAAPKGMRNQSVDATVERVGSWLQRNRALSSTRLEPLETTEWSNWTAIGPAQSP